MTTRISSKGFKLPLFIILIPFLLSIIYYCFFAVDRYESSARVVVRQAGGDQTSGSAGLAILLSGANPASHEETLYLSDYIKSADMLTVLEKNLDWSSHYALQRSDPFFWLADDASSEERLKFYNRMVVTYFDHATGLLEVKVQGLSSDFAEQSLRLILERGEALINELSHRMGRDQVIFAQSELKLARKSYDEHNELLIKFQEQNNVLDAEATATSRSQIVASLESLLAEDRAGQRALLSNLSPNSPQARQKAVRISSLERQLDAEKRKLVANGKGEDQLNIITSKFKTLLLDASIAEEIYKLAVNAVESARIESSKKIRSLMIIVSPNSPDEPVYPKVLYNLATIFMGLSIVYGIARFVIATIEDHRD